MNMRKGVVLSLMWVAMAVFGAAGAWAGGPATLRLPVDGVTADNVNLLQETLETNLKGLYATYQKKGESPIKVVGEGETAAVQFDLNETSVTLSDVERALTDTEFSVNRDSLEFRGAVRITLTSCDRFKEIIDSLASAEYAKVELQDKNLKSVTFVIHDGWRERKKGADFGPGRDTQQGDALFTYERLRELADEYGVKIESVSWGMRKLESGYDHECWYCRSPFGASRVEKAKDDEKEDVSEAEATK